MPSTTREPGAPQELGEVRALGLLPSSSGTSLTVRRIESALVRQVGELLWHEFNSSRVPSIGNRRLIRGDFVTSDRIRLRVTRAPVCPAVSEVGFFAEPAAEPRY